MFNRNINNYDRFRNTRNITIPNITKPNISIPNIIKPNMFIPNIMKPNMSIRNIIKPNMSIPNITKPYMSIPNIIKPNMSIPNITKPNMSIPNIFFNFINLFIYNFFMKQINWYMYLMQNADTYFSNLLVSWLSCFAHSISCIPPPPRRVNMQFRELIRQFVVFQYQLLSFYIYSRCFWYRPSMQVYCWHCCIMRTSLCQLHYMYQCLAVI